MSSRSHHSGHSRSHEARHPPSGGTSDRTGDSDRPLAEVRKNVHDVLRILYQHRWMFFVPCCLAATIVFTLSLRYPRTYSATTTFERRDDPSIINIKANEGTGTFDFWRETMLTDVTSSSVMAEVAEDLGLTKNLPRGDDGTLTEEGVKRRDAIGRSLAVHLQVFAKQVSPHVDRITIQYGGPDANTGGELLEHVKKTYIRQATAQLESFLQGEYQRYAAKTDDAAKELRAAQTRLTQLRLEHPLINPGNPHELPYRIAQREIEQRQLQLRRRELATEIATAEELIVAGRKTIIPEPTATVDGGPVPPAAAPNPEAPLLMEQIRKLGDEIATLKASRGMTDHHPSIVELQSRRQWQEQLLARLATPLESAVTTNEPLALPRDGLRASATADAAPRISSADSFVTELRDRLHLNSLRQHLEDVDESLEVGQARIDELGKAKEQLPAVEEKVANITGEIETNKSRYLLNRGIMWGIEPGLTANAQGKLMEFVEEQPARGGSKPTSPKSKAILLLAALAGIGFGSLFVILAELFDHVFRSSSHVAQSLGIPILESIDEIITAVDRRRLLIKRVVVVPIAICVTLGITGTTGGLAYLSLERPHAYESIRKIPERALEFFTGSEDSAPTLVQVQ